MSFEEDIKHSLIKKFNYLEPAIRIQRARRIFLEVSLENFPQVFEYIARDLKFSHLCTITGLDENEKLSFIYHLVQDPGIMINLKVSVLKENPVIKSIIGIFPGAEIYERELIDLFGAKVEGLPEGNRYPLTDDWPKDEYPLRKDWRPKNA
ncbi:MAG: NADH-quinone oxidoreductase subunit C [Candidatus Omnitrophica bacterium]|nr:NADH-quinone oxidoreductase subunit C [Candidatus Omnitrophota bacterium]